MKTCSVNIIVRDAEGEIGQCLESIIRAGCFSEVVIAVDTRTKDRTVQVIDSYRNLILIKAFWYDHHGVFDEQGARNAALKESKGEYVLWIDADEKLDNPEGFFNLLQNPGKRAFYLHQISLLPDGTYADIPQIRIFPNVKDIKWELPMHSQTLFSLERLGIPIEDTPYRIFHTGYDSSEKITEKHVRNYPVLLGYLSEHRTNDRKRQYIMDRYNESYNYLKSKGELGWVQIVIALIPVIISLVEQGYPYYSALKMAKQMQKDQKIFTETENRELAQALIKQYPQLNFDEWLDLVKATNQIYPPIPNDGGNIPKAEVNYWPYLAIFVIVMVIIKK